MSNNYEYNYDVKLYLWFAFVYVLTHFFTHSSVIVDECKFEPLK